MKPAHREYLPPAISHGGLIRIPAIEFASSIGSLRSARVKWQRGTCSGLREPFTAVPFFWSQHYDVVINYVGHAESYDSTAIEGTLESHDCTVTYRRGERTLAVATISRDLQSLQAERALETEFFAGRPR